MLVGAERSIGEHAHDCQSRATVETPHRGLETSLYPTMTVELVNFYEGNYLLAPRISTGSRLYRVGHNQSRCSTTHEILQRGWKAQRRSRERFLKQPDRVHLFQAS